MDQHPSLFRLSEQRSQSTISLFEKSYVLNRTISEFHGEEQRSTSVLFEPPSNLENISFTFGNQRSPPSTLKLEKKPSNTLPTLFSTRMTTTRPATRPKMNLFSTSILKPSLLSSIKPSKRKFADSEDESQFSQLNLKRPRMLDMNRIRSIVLGTNSSDTQRKFSTYDEYLSSKQPSRAFVLPKLTHRDYYTEPKIEELKDFFNDQGQCVVKEFTVGRKHYGSVTFRGAKMNLAGLNLDRIVEIDRRQVTVYPNENDRPDEGEALNCQAIISLIGVYPIDRSKSHHGEEVTDPQRLMEMNYGNYLEQMTKKFQGSFLDYDVQTGTWKFEVEHF